MKLTRPDLLKNAAYINGQWLPAQNGKSFAVDNPSTLKEIARVPDMGVHETRQAITAADKALPAWAALMPRERAVILRAWANLMVQNANDLAAIMTWEQGKPLAEARGEIIYAASFLEWFAEEGKRAYGDVIPSNIKGARILVMKQPVGVCAAITPWNFPAAMITRKAGPALAAGCTMVLNPPRPRRYRPSRWSCWRTRPAFPPACLTSSPRWTRPPWARNYATIRPCGNCRSRARRRSANPDAPVRGDCQETIPRAWWQRAVHRV